MTTFPHFPPNTFCPICRTSEDKECWLVPVLGTAEDGIVEAAPMHVECTGRQLIGRLRYDREMDLVFCFLQER